MISQIFIMVLGSLAIWFVSRKEDWKRWGYIFGLLGQPFWIYTTIENQQWGILIMTLVYTYSWGQGVWNYWLKLYFNTKNSEPIRENIPYSLNDVEYKRMKEHNSTTVKLTTHGIGIGVECLVDNEWVNITDYDTW